MSIKKAQEQLDLQGSHGNWNHNEYMQGMFNGMECCNNGCAYCLE